MPALVKGRRDWSAILSLGFNIDRNGKRRKPVWINIVTLGILLPGFAMWGLYRVFTTPTSIGLWVLAAALYLFTMFGVTLGNHRYWTHRGFEARFPLRVVGSPKRQCTVDTWLERRPDNVRSCRESIGACVHRRSWISSEAWAGSRVTGPV